VSIHEIVVSPPRLAALDPRRTRFLKELSAGDERLTASQRLLLAVRFGHLYDS
jgi:hypothetical protein